MQYGFGIAIHSDITKFAYLDENGTVLQRWNIPTPVQFGSSHVLTTIAEEIERFMKANNVTEDDIIGIGVGIPGPVSNGGTVNKCVNLGWGVFNIDRALSGMTGLNVVSSNIANVAAMGEYWKGSGKNCRNLLFVSMNMGLGGAIIANGKLVQGANGGAGEIGHFAVNRQETECCTCGNCGCLEQYFSPLGIARTAKREIATSITKTALRFKRNLTHEDVFQAASTGDKLATQVLDKVCEYAGESLANICCVTNPETIILGGELCKHGKVLLDRVSRYFRQYVFHANKDVRFVLASLGEDAAVIGAFKLVLDTYR